MGQFEQLDEMLATAYPGDAWGDHGVLLAADVLRAFKADDWARLASNWATRPASWQCLLADVLLDGDPLRAVPVLVDFIHCGSGAARVGACDSLRVLLQGRPEPLEVGPALKAAVADLRTEAPAPWSESLVKLLELLR